MINTILIIGTMIGIILGMIITPKKTTIILITYITIMSIIDFFNVNWAWWPFRQ